MKRHHAGDRQRVEEMTRAEKDEHRKAQADLKTLMNTPQGRRFMFRLLARTRIGEQPFTGDAWTNFNCGVLNVGCQYMADINEACPETYWLMMKENTPQPKAEAEETGGHATTKTEGEDS